MWSKGKAGEGRESRDRTKRSRKAEAVRLQAGGKQITFRYINPSFFQQNFVI